jgi:hypothetical protein
LFRSKARAGARRAATLKCDTAVTGFFPEVGSLATKTSPLLNRAMPTGALSWLEISVT